MQKHSFDCGDKEINNYLYRSLETCDNEGFAKTFFMLSENKEVFIGGFYTLSTQSISVQELPDEFTSGISFPCPAILIGQFAIDKSLQGQKLSRQLLWDAYRRIILIQKQIGCRAIKVDTRTEIAKNFWLKQGFIPLKKRKSSLFLPIKILLIELEND